VKRTLVVLISALTLSACGSTEQSAAPAASATAAATETSAPDRTALVADANAVCKQAQPAMDRAGEAIEASADKSRAANRRAWKARDETMQATFTRLRALEKQGVDKPYDAFLAKWGVVLTYLGMLVRDLGQADVDQLNQTFEVLQQTANELVDVAVAADVLDCAAPFAPGGEPEAGDES